MYDDKNFEICCYKPTSAYKQERKGGQKVSVSNNQNDNIQRIGLIAVIFVNGKQQNEENRQYRKKEINKDFVYVKAANLAVVSETLWK